MRAPLRRLWLLGPGLAVVLLSVRMRSGGWFHHDIWVAANRDWGLADLIRPADGHLAMVGVAVSKLMLEGVGFAYGPWNVLRAVAWLLALLAIAAAAARLGARPAIVLLFVVLFYLSPLTLWMEGWYVGYMITLAGASWLVVTLDTDDPTVATYLLGGGLGAVIALSSTLGAVLLASLSALTALRRRWQWVAVLAVPSGGYALWYLLVRGSPVERSIAWHGFPAYLADLLGSAVVGHVPFGVLVSRTAVIGVLVAVVVGLLAWFRPTPGLAGAALAIGAYSALTFAFRVSAGRTSGPAAHYSLAVSVLLAFWVLAPAMPRLPRWSNLMVGAIIAAMIVPAAIRANDYAGRRSVVMAAYRERVEGAAEYVWSGSGYHADGRVGDMGPLPASWLFGFERYFPESTSGEGRHAGVGVGDVLAVDGAFRGAEPGWMQLSGVCGPRLEDADALVVEGPATIGMEGPQGTVGIVDVPEGPHWVDLHESVSTIRADVDACAAEETGSRPLLRSDF